MDERSNLDEMSSDELPTYIAF